MKTPWIWVDLAAIVALLFFVVLLIDNIVQHGKGWAKRFWKSHIVDDFPEPAAAMSKFLSSLIIAALFCSSVSGYFSS